ncbi:MAG: zinc-ribbon domain-containing protein [Burkholderiales bacterium]|nr:zinc-ribbon domain-containing protein [Burkholderiales bacterium]
MSLVTRCPECVTAYRVSQAQLDARGGRVRCGRCGEVFDAVACAEEPAVPAQVGLPPHGGDEAPQDEPPVRAEAPALVPPPDRSPMDPAPAGDALVADASHTGTDSDSVSPAAGESPEPPAWPSEVAADRAGRDANDSAPSGTDPAGASEAPADAERPEWKAAEDRSEARAETKWPEWTAAEDRSESTAETKRPEWTAAEDRTETKAATERPEWAEAADQFESNAQTERPEWTAASFESGSPTATAPPAPGEPEATSREAHAATPGEPSEDDTRPADAPSRQLVGDAAPAAWLAGIPPQDETQQQPASAGGGTGQAAAYEFGPPSRPRPARAWWLAGSLLVLALAAQAVFFLRGPIALLWPQAKPLLVTACGTLGCEVPLPRRADMVSIEHSDLQADPARPGVMVLTATLRNRAPFPQDFPALELTLTNRLDQPLARRVIEPRDYLARLAPEGFGASSESQVRLPMNAASVGASGYRLYLFYP